MGDAKCILIHEKRLAPSNNFTSNTPFDRCEEAHVHNLASGAIHSGQFDTQILMRALFKARLPKKEHKFTGMQCLAEPYIRCGLGRT